MNSKIDEEKFICSILSDLIHNYPDHCADELSYILSMVKYRLDQLEQAQVAKYESNERKVVKNSKKL